MSYSACDFMDDVLRIAHAHGAITSEACDLDTAGNDPHDGDTEPDEVGARLDELEAAFKRAALAGELLAASRNFVAFAEYHELRTKIPRIETQLCGMRAAIAKATGAQS